MHGRPARTCCACISCCSSIGICAVELELAYGNVPDPLLAWFDYKILPNVPAQYLDIVEGVPFHGNGCISAGAVFCLEEQLVSPEFNIILSALANGAANTSTSYRQLLKQIITFQE